MTGIERLREWANELREAARAYRDGEIDYVPIDVEACQRKNAAKLDAIADQIERETLQKPRFEDGEPVQFGDEFHCGNSQTTVGDTWNVKRMTFYSNGNTIVADNRFSSTMLAPCERLRRPEPPKVLDADGVEIKVGDKVWMVEDGDGPWTVEKIDGERVSCVSDVSKWHRYARCSVFTHRRPAPPDTWERIEKDVDSGEGYAGMDKAEAMADVLRRCKKLAGVE